MTDSKQSIGKGFAILSAASIIVKLLSLLFIPLMSHILGNSGYGVFGQTYQIFAFIYLIANSGFPVAVSKFVSELSEKGLHKSALKSFKIARTFLLVIGLLLSLLMIIIANPIAKAMASEEATIGLMVLAPSILVTAVLSAYRGYFQGRHNMVPTAVTQVVEQIAHIAFSSVFAYLLIKKSLALGVAGSAVGTSAGALIALLMIIVFFNRYVKNGHAVPGDSVMNVHSFRYLSHKLIKYAIPITLSAAIQFGGNLVDVFVTKNRLIDSGMTKDAAETVFGFLTKFQQLINVPLSVIIALSVALLPSVSASFAVKDSKAAARKINYSFKLCYLIAFPAAFALSVLNKGIYSLLAFHGGEGLMMLGAFVLLFSATVQIQTSILQSINRLYYAMISLIIGIAVKIILNYTLIVIPSIGIYGTIIGTYASMLVTMTINMFIIKRREQLNISLLKEIKKPLISSILMALAMFIVYYPLRTFLLYSQNKIIDYIMNLVVVAAASCAGLLAYFISMAKSGGITKEILNSVSPHIYRLLPGFLKKILLSA